MDLTLTLTLILTSAAILMLILALGRSHRRQSRCQGVLPTVNSCTSVNDPKHPCVL